MFLRELFENDSAKHAAFCFGRMNPPTVGHQQLINAVAKAGRGGDFFIFTSQSQDPKKNPLDYETKVRFLRALYPDIASHIVYEPGLKTIMHVAQWLYKNGYRNVTFVAGSDRLADFKELLEKYNGVEGPNGMYKFNRINFVSSGERDPDSEGVAGVSASAARAAAAAGDYEAFAQAVGGGKLTQQLYNAVRQGMNLAEAVTGQIPSDETMNISGADLQRLRRLPQYRQGYDAQSKQTTGALKNPYELGSDQYNAFHTGASDAYLKNNSLKVAEEAISDYPSETGAALLFYKKVNGIEFRLTKQSGRYKVFINSKRHIFPDFKSAKTFLYDEMLKLYVSEDASGYIPKNKKEAKDPRWSNALSVDVTPETPAKNARAFRLI